MPARRRSRHCYAGAPLLLQWTEYLQHHGRPPPFGAARIKIRTHCLAHGREHLIVLSVHLGAQAAGHHFQSGSGRELLDERVDLRREMFSERV